MYEATFLNFFNHIEIITTSKECMSISEYLNLNVFLRTETFSERNREKFIEIYLFPGTMENIAVMGTLYTCTTKEKLESFIHLTVLL